MSLRIIGGSALPANHTFSFLALLYKDGNIKCGAILHSPSWGITAAHCIERPAGQYSLRSRPYNTSIFPNDECDDFVQVTKTLCHLQFDVATNENDICLLKLERPIACANTTTFPTFQVDQPYTSGMYMSAVGWGRTNVVDVDTYPEVPHIVSLPYVNKANCEQFLSMQITVNMLCAGAYGIDSCIGDSGGPLFIQQGSSIVVTGIVSWGIGCGTLPGVYTNVRQYTGWITDTISNHMQNNQTWDEESCTCTLDGVSGTYNTGKVGCRDHTAEGVNWCYTKGVKLQSCNCFPGIPNGVVDAMQSPVTKPHRIMRTILCIRRCLRRRNLCQYGEDCADCGFRYISYEPHVDQSESASHLRQQK